MALRSSASGTNYVVFKFLGLRRQICYAAFSERIVRTHYWDWNLIVAYGSWQTDNCCFVHGPAFEMRQLKASRDFVGASLWQQTPFWPGWLRVYGHS
jgi:hypothetical protein